MKKLIIVFCMVFAAMASKAQSWNPYVSQGIITPAPMLPAEFNGIGEISFHIGNTGSSSLEYSPELSANNLKVVITLYNGVPDQNDPVSAIGGSWSSWFQWSYDEAARTYTGIQKNTIEPYSEGTINIGYKVVDNSPLVAPGNGFRVALTPPAYVGNINHTQDDVVSSRTYTSAYDFGDAPLSYGAARHEINLNRNPVTGLYTRFVYMGTKVDAEPEPLSSPEANGDDSDNINDEDGVVFPVLIAGKSAIIPVVVTVHGQSWGVLNAWFDWNGDGDFADAGEKVQGTPMMIYSSGTYNLLVKVPRNAITSRSTFARFRVGPNVGFSAPAAWGEAEDYMITIQNAPEVVILPGEVREIDFMQNPNSVRLAGERDKSDIKLNWSMSSEFNTDWFEVERSTDGSEFEPIGDRIIAAGNKTVRTEYSFIDENVTCEVAIYRIRLINKNMSASLSNEYTEIMDNNASLNIAVYPVPVIDWYSVSIDTPGSYQLELFNVSGRIVYSTPMEVLTGNGDVKRLSRTGYVGGQYFMRVTDKKKGSFKTVKVTFLQ